MRVRCVGVVELDSAAGRGWGLGVQILLASSELSVEFQRPPLDQDKRYRIRPLLPIGGRREMEETIFSATINAVRC